jgi:hypothetical protein
MKNLTPRHRIRHFRRRSETTNAVFMPRTGTWLQTGTLIFMRISRVLKTGQPAVSREGHLKNISLTHPIGEPMRTINKKANYSFGKFADNNDGIKPSNRGGTSEIPFSGHFRCYLLNNNVHQI